jgi:Uma2 family endonuclease
VICDLAKIDKRGCVGAPDIVVEVLSKGNNSKELKNKYEVYEEAGVKEYWLVSPQNQSVTIYILRDGKFHTSRILSTGDIVTSSVLPDFSLDLTELFKGSEED